MKQIKNAFTLVELIVVITILAVLATVGFISFTWYTQSARDSARVTDIRTIEKALVFYQTQNNIFPDPSDFENISINDGGDVNLWKSWVIGKSVITEVRSISQIPEDPNTQEFIRYSTTLNNQEYQLMGYLEDLYSQNIITQTQARTDFPKVSGNYNKYFVIGDDNTYYATPSLFASGSDVTNASTFDVDKKVIEFEVKKLQNLSWWDITVDNIQSNFTDLWKALQKTYSGSQVEDNYDQIIGIDNDNQLNDFVQLITGKKQNSSNSNVCNYVEPIKTCASGWDLNGNTCEQTLTTTISSDCPSGYSDTWNETCEKVTSTPANASCPSGYSISWNSCYKTISREPSYWSCDSGYYTTSGSSRWDKGQTCYKNIGHIKDPNHVCNSWYTKNKWNVGNCTDTKAYITNDKAQCELSGGTYYWTGKHNACKFLNPVEYSIPYICTGTKYGNQCVDTSQTSQISKATCSSWYSYNSYYETCRKTSYTSKNYSCSSGTLNGSVCEQTETIAKPDGSCAEWYTLESDNLTCTKVETQIPSFSCESWFILNEDSNKCEREEFISC